MRQILILCFFIGYNSLAQTDCKNNVSTNVSSPTNNALPVNGGSLYINGFDWLPIVGGLYDTYSTTSMSFAGVPITSMNGIMTGRFGLEQVNFIIDRDFITRQMVV